MLRRAALLSKRGGFPRRLAATFGRMLGAVPVRPFSSGTEGDGEASVSAPSFSELIQIFDAQKGIFYAVLNGFFLHMLLRNTARNGLPPVEHHDLDTWNPVTFVQDSGEALLSFLEMTHPFQPEISEETKSHLREMVVSDKMLEDWLKNTAESAEEFDEGELTEWANAKYELVKVNGISEFQTYPCKPPHDTDFFDESSTHRHHESMLNRHLYAAIGVKYEFRLVHPEQPLNFYPTNVECTFLGCLRGDDPLMWRISHLDELSTDLDEGAE